ncbi:zinc finger and SCAN domain-containing protein 12-like [Pantherophis guttatus]|uniref:Zinc finger and SCAN domain-containing protein 12-like n=1 Tax=Pantherophis guttatus TaxID=94885 RepID=A0A6P9C7C7_PANGU|nr:zinc finger and SCAN domain-containing protein 12-like [Pantherophis guttatus]XP_034275504.1 zinc finger and SCAN domain-containing protein 12-like [Pantherophis guttatus]
METGLTFDRESQLQSTSKETYHSINATELPSLVHRGNTEELLPQTTSQEGPPKTSQCWKDAGNGSSLVATQVLQSMSSQSWPDAMNREKLQSNEMDSPLKSSDPANSSEEVVAGVDTVPEVVSPLSLPLKNTWMLQLHLEDDIEDYLEGFESVAYTNRWPRAEWVAKLKPYLSRKALLACSILEPNIANDYDIVKERILNQYGITTEMQRQCFRQFRYQEAMGPRETCQILQALGRRWLKPERHTKEQILELLILEQFLIILPPEMQDWVRGCCPETCAQVVDLVESFQLGNEPPVPLKDIDVKFSNEEWALLTEEQRALYDDVTLQNFQNMSTLGIPLEKPEVITRIQQGGELYFQNNTINSPKDRFIANQLSPTVTQGVEKRSFLKRATKTVKVQAIAMEVPQDSVGLGETLVKEPSSNSIKEAAASVPSTSTLPLKKPLISSKPKSSKRKKHQPSRTDGLASTKGRDQPSLLQKRSGKKESGSQISTAKAGKQKKILVPQGAKSSQLKKPTASVGQHPKQKKKSEVLSEPPMLNKETLLSEKIVQDKEHQLAFLEVKVHETSLPVTTWNPPFSATVVSDLTCLECGRSFKQRFDLRQHRYVHTREKPYACTLCEKCFRHPSNLHIHLRTHSGERPYQCPECGKAFSQSCNLRTHSKIHTGNKPYKCFVCGKSFCHSSNLTIHQRIHTGERPYPCSVCSKRFSDRSTLVQHERTHTGEKPYACAVCGQRFSQISHLVKHGRMHPDTGDPAEPTEDSSSNTSKRVFMPPGGKASFRMKGQKPPARDENLAWISKTWASSS